MDSNFNPNKKNTFKRDSYLMKFNKELRNKDGPITVVENLSDENTNPVTGIRIQISNESESEVSPPAMIKISVVDSPTGNNSLNQ